MDGLTPSGSQLLQASRKLNSQFAFHQIQMGYYNPSILWVSIWSAAEGHDTYLCLQQIVPLSELHKLVAAATADPMPNNADFSKSVLWITAAKLVGRASC